KLGLTFAYGAKMYFAAPSGLGRYPAAVGDGFDDRRRAQAKLSPGIVLSALRELSAMALLLLGFEDGLDAVDHGLRIELAADDLVGAVGEYGDAVVADEDHFLIGTVRLYFAAELLGGGDASVALDIDDDEGILAGLCQFQALVER